MVVSKEALSYEKAVVDIIHADDKYHFGDPGSYRGQLNQELEERILKNFACNRGESAID